ncbi:iron chelate uptake ABC transporter family permease subunit, partial [Burkholderia ambifaria]|uniref:iron chelate uptake ABC transporter family permease subunit n=1 Tax=Burkholderia ambifaria TaxID=152480 RepID=UPI00158B2F3A
PDSRLRGMVFWLAGDLGSAAPPWFALAALACALLAALPVAPQLNVLLPAAALAGGTAVMAADLVARTVIAPAQLPVGAMTALIGVPVFLWMLLRGPGR